MPHRIELSSQAQRQLARLPRQVQERIGRAIDELGDAPRPRGAVKLRGTVDRYRIRAGNYRIIYEIWDQELWILVVDIGQRREVYR